MSQALHEDMVKSRQGTATLLPICRLTVATAWRCPTLAMAMAPNDDFKE